MSQPLPYERDFDFEGFQSGHPSTPLPGDKVNLEFDQVAETLDQVLDRIARLQRDDLELANQSVGFDQLKPEISFGATAASSAIAAAASATAAAAAAQASAASAAAAATSISSTAYNAVHDGGANNSGLSPTGAALQAAAAAAAAAGKPLLIPQGVYMFGAGESLNPPSGLHIIGQPGAIFRKVTDEAVPIIYAPSGSNVSGVRISGLTFEYTAATTLVLGAQNCAICFIKATDILVEDCVITGRFYVSSYVDSGSIYRFDNCTARGFINRGFYTAAGIAGSTADTMKHVTYNNCVADGLDGGLASNVGRYGFNENGFGTGTLENILYQGCSALGVYGHGFTASEKTVNTRIIGCHVVTTSADCVGFYVAEGNGFRVQRSTLVGCTAIGGFNGFVLTGADHAQVIGCSAEGAVDNGFYIHNSTFAQIIGCRSNNNTGSGFLVDATAPSDTQYITFDACAATGNTVYGLSISVNVLNPSVDNSTFLNNTAANENIGSLSLRRGASAPQVGTDNALVRRDGASGGNVQDSLAILDDSGGLRGLTAEVIGHTASLAIAASGTVTPAGQMIGVDAATAAMGFACFSTSAAISSQFNFYKSANATIGQAAVVANNDRIFAMNFFGAQQTGTFSNQVLGAQFLVEVDGVVTSGAGADMPMRYVWKTAADGGGLTTHFVIGADGKVTSSNGGLVAAGWFAKTVPTTYTTDFTVLVTDNDIISNRAATNTGTLPSAASFPGREMTIKTLTAFTVVSNASNVVPITGGAAGTAILPATAGKWARLVSNSVNWEIMASG